MTAENAKFRGLKRTKRSRRHDEFTTTTGIDVASLATNLVRDKQGIWCSAASAKCAYPDGDHDILFAIEDESFWFQHRNKCIIEVVKKFPPSGFILDVGGGNGFVTLGLNDAGIASILLEPNKRAVQNALQRGVSPIVCATIENAGFQRHSVPAAGLFDVLEHIEDDTDFLRYLKGVLSPAGRLYLTVPAHQMLWSLDDEYARHYRRYNRKSLARTLTQSGYVVDYVTHFFSYLSIPLFFLKMLRSKSRFAKIRTSEEVRQEHMPKSRIVNRTLRSFQALEVACIRRRIVVPVGSSLIATAHPGD